MLMFCLRKTRRRWASGGRKRRGGATCRAGGNDRDGVAWREGRRHLITRSWACRVAGERVVFAAAKHDYMTTSAAIGVRRIRAVQQKCMR